MWRQLIFHKSLIPDITTESIPSFAYTYSQFEISFTEFITNFLESFADVEADFTIHTEH